MDRSILIARAKNRIIAHTSVDENGCWIWNRHRSKDGYGQMLAFGKVTESHRVSFALFREDIPPGMTVDHNCFVRACCNPYHLDLMTHAENAARKAASFRSTCINGHEFNAANTYIPAGSSIRYCRVCNRIAQARRKQRRKCL